MTRGLLQALICFPGPRAPLGMKCNELERPGYLGAVVTAMDSHHGNPEFRLALGLVWGKGDLNMKPRSCLTDTVYSRAQDWTLGQKRAGVQI